MYSQINIENINKGFGNLADEYDRLQHTNMPVSIMREKFYDVVTNLVEPGANLLEINCGSGIDAIYFGDKGYKVLATDVSDKMLFNAKAKNKNENVEFMKMDFTEPGIISNKKFDLVYSNLGGLNCTDKLGRISYDFYNLLNDGGYFVAVVMPNFFLWEFLLFIKGEFKRAFRRMNKNRVQANVGGEKINVKYYSPRVFKKYFVDNSPSLKLRRTGFQFIKTKALRVFAPAPPAGHFYTKHPSFTKFLDKIDNKIEDYYLSAFLCDYYIIVLKKLN